METVVQKIPDALIYENVNGKPIYYKGYKEYIKGGKQIEELMGSSYLQGALGTQLIILLSNLLDLTIYRLISNEIGLMLGENMWRAADIAIFNKKDLIGIPLKNKYLSIAPEIIVEIDTKADLDEVENPLGYYQEKTDQLLTFGVKKVIWIFTDTQKIMLAEKNSNWQIFDWSKDVFITDNVSVNVLTIIKELEIL